MPRIVQSRMIIWEVRDLGSSNGTWNDGGRITTEVLNDGAVFRIGRTYMRFEGDERTDFSGTLVGDDGHWEDPGHIETLAESASFLQRHGGKPDEDLRHINEYLILLHQVVLRSNEADNRETLFEVLDDVAADALGGGSLRGVPADARRLGIVATA